MKFTITGKIEDKGSFSMEFEAKSKKQAEDTAYSFFGSKHGVKRGKITILSVEKAKA